MNCSFTILLDYAIKCLAIYSYSIYTSWLEDYFLPGGLLPAICLTVTKVGCQLTSSKSILIGWFMAESWKDTLDAEM